jgi:hypothetical protein
MATQNIPQGATLDAMIAGLVSAGYHVSFTEGFGAEPFGAHVEFPGDPDAGCTALGYTAALALAAALPEAVEESLTALAPAAPAEVFAADVWETVYGIEERLNALEAERDLTGRDVRTLIRCLADFIAQDHPGGFTAAGDSGDGGRLLTASGHGLADLAAAAPSQE